jgi:hypothetical protein
MATTIDSLQIEIQSNSNNAAASIDSLAKALKKLNKNSDINGAVTSLNNLRKSLHAFVNMPSNASKIESLANSLKSLSKVKKIDLGDSLASVKRSMESLGTINVDNVAPQIERIAGALGPLANVKGGGFNSLMNGLKKIGEVTAGLDEATITAFVAKVKELDEKLGPLSTKMFAVSNAFNVVNRSAVSAGGGMKSFKKDVSVAALNLTNFIDVAKSAYAALQPLIRLLTRTIGDAMEWDGIEYQFGNAFGEQADEYYQKITEISDALMINKQTFMESSAMATSMLKGFGVNSVDARKMGLGYTELAYDIWAAYNNVYKSLDGADGAMAAVRSAIAGEVEPIRRAGFTIVDSQLKITAANHGIAYSSEKATEAQKSYLRYLTLVDQAHTKGIVGTYASEMEKAEGQIRTFRQQLTTLSQTFGSVFLPILVKVMPWLNAFVELLGDAIIAVANFFGVDIQKVDFSDSFKGVTGGADEATGSIKDTTSALKELKNATLGIDELNVISPPDPKSGSGASGGGAGWDSVDVDSLWDKSIYDQVQTQVDELKQKIKDMLPTVGLLGTALGGLTAAKLLSSLDEAAIKIKGLGKGLTVGSIAIAVGTLVWDFTGAYLETGNWLYWLASLGTTALGAGIAYKFGGKGGAGITLLVSGIAQLGRLVFELSEGTVDFGDPQTWITMTSGSLSTFLGGFLTWKAFGPTIKTAVSNFVSKISWSSVATSVGGALSGAMGKITGAFAAIPGWGWIATIVVAAIGGAIALAVTDYDFTEVGHKLGEAIGKAARKVVDFFKEIGGGIKDAFNKAIDWVYDTFDIDNVLELLNLMFNPTQWITKLAPKLLAIGIEVLPGILKGVKDGLKNLGSNIKEFIDGVVKGFKDGFEIKSPSKKMIPIGKEIVNGIWKGITDSFNGIVKNVQKWATDLIGKATAAMKPSAISSKLSSMWTTAKNWWNNSKGTLSTYTPAIGDIKAKLSSAWTTARNWWTKSKAALATYTPSIGSIKDRLVSAWNTAKAWWNSNVRLSIPSLSFRITYTTKGLSGIQKAVVKALGLSGWPKLSFAKNGGMFDMGSLIWAGEAGAEVVANAGGGRTGVMNVEQMQNAVYEGVYSAVVAAMRATPGDGGSKSVNVYLDGRQLTSAVEKRQHERGAALMGKEVFAY